MGTRFRVPPAAGPARVAGRRGGLSNFDSGGRVLGPRSAKALSKFDSAAPVLRTKRVDAHQRPWIAALATGPGWAL
jgi:hypothetical protein